MWGTKRNKEEEEEEHEQEQEQEQEQEKEEEQELEQEEEEQEQEEEYEEREEKIRIRKVRRWKRRKKTYLSNGSILYFHSASRNLMRMPLMMTTTEPRASPRTCR